MSKLQFNDFLFSRKAISSCMWWHSHQCLCSVLGSFYLFRLMFLVYLSPGLHTLFFSTCLTLGDCSWVTLVELTMTLFDVFSGAEWLPVTFYAVLMMFNATCTMASNAFDCLSHDRLIAKLSLYGLSLTSQRLLSDYLSIRKQRIKVENIFS